MEAPQDNGGGLIALPFTLPNPGSSFQGNLTKDGRNANLVRLGIGTFIICWQARFLTAQSSRSSRQRLSFPIAQSGMRVVVTDDGSRTLLESESSLAWHSESGALTESQHVYLRNSGVFQRLQEGKKTNVLEIGFGTGLCFWLTASAACHGDAQLDYTSFEHRLLPATVLEPLKHGEIEECQPAYERFSPSVFEAAGLMNGQLSCQVDSVSLKLVTRDVNESPELPSQLDAIFHDPFSPEATPEMWSEDLFSRLFAQLKPSGKLVTYCVKSSIQRLLGRVGFEVAKKKGPPGGKREVLVATHPD